MEQNKKIWFKRKRFGLGWVPVSREGWLVTIAYILVMYVMFVNITKYQYSGSDALIAFALPFIIGTSIFIFICYRTGESLKWQWGPWKNPWKKFRK